MQRRSIVISVALHGALVLAFTVSLPFMKRELEIPPPLSVEIMNIDKMTETDKPAEVKPVEQKPVEDKPPPEQKKPPSVAQNKSDMPIAPPKPDPKKEPKPKVEKKQEKIDPDALPDKKKDKKKEKPKEEEEDTSRDFSSVLKNLADTKETQKSDSDNKSKDPSQTQANVAPLGRRMSMSEMDAFRSQLEGCWNIPIGAKEAENLNIEILMSIGQDRVLREAHVVDTARYNSDTFFRAAADSALRAVRSPLCSPFDLPPDKYDQWKEITVNFNPREMF
jgi:hypothetical protein